MTYGITGNTMKEALWMPVAELVTHLDAAGIPFVLHANVATGLIQRALVDATLCQERSVVNLAERADLILSFGGDGTILRTAHEVDSRGIPILGVNIGRLGFLADVDIGKILEAIDRLESGDYTLDTRLALSVAIDGEESEQQWALNDVVIARAGPAGLIAIDVVVDSTPLNRYWADGLIISTPTGSTAYSLAVGGPIVAPGSDVVILSPIAPHSLTIRPVVLPSGSVIEASVAESRHPYILAIDGQSFDARRDAMTITIRSAPHRINLVKFTDQHYFRTLRNKLSWGRGPQAGTG